MPRGPWRRTTRRPATETKRRRERTAAVRINPTGGPKPGDDGSRGIGKDVSSPYYAWCESNRSSVCKLENKPSIFHHGCTQMNTDGPNGWTACRLMHQLPDGDWHGAQPASELRLVPSRQPAFCPRSVKCSEQLCARVVEIACFLARDRHTPARPPWLRARDRPTNRVAPKDKRLSETLRRERTWIRLVPGARPRGGRTVEAAQRKCSGCPYAGSTPGARPDVRSPDIRQHWRTGVGARTINELLRIPV